MSSISHVPPEVAPPPGRAARRLATSLTTLLLMLGGLLVMPSAAQAADYGPGVWNGPTFIGAYVAHGRADAHRAGRPVPAAARGAELRHGPVG